MPFFVDITSLLTELNVKLQGKGKLLPDVFSDVKAYEMKLKLIRKHINEKNFTHLPFCKSAYESFQDKSVVWPKEEFSEMVEILRNEFSSCFIDFHAHSKDIRLLQNPFSVDI